jgi:hypothetical protein
VTDDDLAERILAAVTAWPHISRGAQHALASRRP